MMKVAAQLALVAPLLLTAGPAAAHDLAIGQARVEQIGSDIHLELALPFDELADAIGITSVAGGQDADAARLAALAAREAAFADLMAADVRVRRGGTACLADHRGVDLVRHRDVPFAVVDTVYACAAEGAHELRYDLLFDVTGHASHAVLVDYDLDGRVGQAVLEPGARTLAADGVARSAPRAAAQAAIGPAEGGAGSAAPLLAGTVACLTLLAGLVRLVRPRRAAT